MIRLLKDIILKPIRNPCLHVTPKNEFNRHDSQRYTWQHSLDIKYIQCYTKIKIRTILLF